MYKIICYTGNNNGGGGSGGGGGGTVGRWSPWSEWSRCGRDCRQARRRSCVSPSSSGQASDQSSCVGRNLQLVPCTGGLCPDDPHLVHEEGG